MNDRIEMTETLIINIEVQNPLYQYFAEQILALDELKRSSTFSKSHAINLMYVPVLTMFIESCLSEVIDEYLFQIKKGQGDNLFSRLIDTISADLDKGWQQSQVAFRSVFGWDFKAFVAPETVKAVTHLFGLRNKLIHGKRPNYSISNLDTAEEQTTWGDNYRNLHAYLIEKGLTDARTSEFVTTPVTDKAIGHFVGATISFAESVVNKVEAEHGTLQHLPFKAHVIEKLRHRVS